MICLSSAGSLAPFDGESSTRAARGCVLRRRSEDRLWKCDAQALPCTCARWCTEAASDCCGAEATSTPTGPSVVRLWRQPSDRPEAAGARPALPDFSQCRGATSAPRQRPTPVRTHGGTHRGGVGTPLEGTYFQAEPGNAICVQSLDDSLNSAIHITYHISLRSSSLREPRYPSTGVVVWVVVSARTHTDPAKRSRARTRAVGWGGALQTAVGDDRQGGSSRSTRAFPFP